MFGVGCSMLDVPPGSWEAPSVWPPRIGTMNRIVLVVVLVLETESASRGRARGRGRRLRFMERATCKGQILFDSAAISPPTLRLNFMSDPAQILRDFKPTRE